MILWIQSNYTKISTTTFMPPMATSMAASRNFRNNPKHTISFLSFFAFILSAVEQTWKNIYNVIITSSKTRYFSLSSSRGILESSNLLEDMRLKRFLKLFLLSLGFFFVSGNGLSTNRPASSFFDTLTIS